MRLIPFPPPGLNLQFMLIGLAVLPVAHPVRQLSRFGLIDDRRYLTGIIDASGKSFISASANGSGGPGVSIALLLTWPDQNKSLPLIHLRMSRLAHRDSPFGLEFSNPIQAADRNCGN